MLLFELYNQPYEWDYHHGPSSHSARFTTKDGIEYEVTFDEVPVKELDPQHKNIPPDNPNIWVVMFRRVGTPGEAGTYYPTGSGDQFRVFSTVLDIIRKTTKEFGIKQYAFSAHHPKQEKVFARFAQLLSKEGYDIIEFVSKFGERTWAFKSQMRRWLWR